MKKVKIALLGFGTVGTGTWKIINENREDIIKHCGYDIEISKVLVKDTSKDRGLDISRDVFTNDIRDIINDSEIEIVVELMGGIDPAKAYIMGALNEKKHVVTANKALIATHGKEIIETAEQAGVKFLYEASVAGGIPIIHSIKESLTGNKIEEIIGIMNGTTNYILTKMAKEKVDFKTVLKEAQDLGYAEADPTADIEGYDAAHKLTILASLAYGHPVNFDNIYREGITKIDTIDIEYANEMGYVIKLLAIAKEKEGTMELRVHPTFISKNHPLAAVNDSFNAVFLKGNAVGELMFYGRGAGDLPTGSAVVGDIVSILKTRENPYIVKQFNRKNPIKRVKPMQETRCEYYVRLLAEDKSGVLGKVSSIFGQHGVSISSMIQKGERECPVSLVFVTHYTEEGNIQNAIEEIKSLSEVVEISNIIRLENGKKY
ncbi:homoserine dehydrogenase [Serpentinicella sp. ANB-PHB4]|uniref:homoserine dehydrogenase n=1 Tax=Serpentinicella sp. ANB-PHB4 TaxID=3074076 RepID=UPI0028568C23|nr:homoserine dehydrogenase [Serpentinicella sp. ANB-PHB4]MDR5659151.1 homoserine dehydrogenase [Serpentinicella sp. ANB-PHB4]